MSCGQIMEPTKPSRLYNETRSLVVSYRGHLFPTTVWRNQSPSNVPQLIIIPLRLINTDGYFVMVKAGWIVRKDGCLYVVDLYVQKMVNLVDVGMDSLPIIDNE